MKIGSIYKAADTVNGIKTPGGYAIIRRIDLQKGTITFSVSETPDNLPKSAFTVSNDDFKMIYQTEIISATDL